MEEKMKKILTTTVMTAILATSGFAGEAVGPEVYNVFDFCNGTDSNETTIMPSGTINIGCSGKTPLIESKWTLQEGSTMNVKEDGFKLTGTIKINPKDAKETYVQCDLQNEGTLYYEYLDGQNKIYRLVSDPDAKYVNSSKAEITPQPTSTPKQVKTAKITGVPQLDSSVTDRDNAMITIDYKSEPKTTTLPKNAKVVTYKTTTSDPGYSSSPCTCNLSEDANGDPLTFYVYNAKFSGITTEVYSTTKYTGDTIDDLWYGWDNGCAHFNDTNLGTSNVYVLGLLCYTATPYLVCSYYTELCNGVNMYAFVMSEKVTNVSLKYDRGCISGGSVTYAKATDPILSEDASSDLTNTSLANIAGNKYKLDKAASNGFTEGYLTKFPSLTYKEGETEKTLSVGTINAYTAPQLANSDSLETYLNSFGFYPDEVSISKSNIELLATKSKEDAIQVPKDTAFSTATSKKTHEIKANLHNVGVDNFTEALSFIGTDPTDPTLDTLVFSGDNSNLTPEMGVTYTNVNVTFDCENSWIEPKADGICFQGATTTPTLSINADTAISQPLTVFNANFKVGDNAKVKILNHLTLK